MKAIATLMIICLVGCFTACRGQSTSENKKKQAQAESTNTESSKQMNLLDEQTKMFGNIFELAGSSEDNPFEGTENYGELIEKMNLPEEQKKMLREQYKAYDLSLDPAKKDSLKIMVGKMLENAMEKSRNDPNNQ